MSSEHIRFITVGFAELVNNLPDDHYGPCPICGLAMIDADDLHTTDDGGDVHFDCCVQCNGPTASDPSLRDYWPDVCDTCHVHEGHEPSCPNNRDDEEALPEDYDYRADYDGPLTEDDR